VVKLSALICVQNQEAQLSQCLRKLSFCDEIVVVADRCTDRSQEIARRHGAVVIPGIFPLESQRKAVGADACTGDWILEIEPEEVVGSALAWEIRATLQMRPDGDHFEVPFDNHVGERLVRRGWVGGLGVASATRLYRRGAKHWAPQRLADGAVLTGVSAGSLKGALHRKAGDDIGEVIDRLNRLTGLRAEDLADTRATGGAVEGTVRGMGKFFGSYVARGGWREGRLGFLLALMAGLYPLLSHLRAREVLEARRTLDAAPLPARRREVVGIGVR
jgi:glycosyltransferase involved in cell wall biosynthesis